MKAIIAAAGSGDRWGEYLGRRKHFVSVTGDGEWIINRMIRLLRERGILDITVTCRPELCGAYSFDGAKTFAIEPSKTNVGAHLDHCLAGLWPTDERVLVLWGDVFLTEAAADIVSAEATGWVQFARLAPSVATGKPGPEIIGRQFGPESHAEYESALRAVLGASGKTWSSWSVYSAMTGGELSTPPGEIVDRGRHVNIPDDGTDDFDFPDDFERWMFHRRRSSRRVNASEFAEPWLQERRAEMGLHPKLHRKLWEHCAIAQGFVDRGFRGGSVLGFGVGKESLPGWFAGRGCSVVATDRPERGVWLERQHANGLSDLRRVPSCSEGAFSALVEYRPVDMRSIPADLRDKFDVTWSAGSFEHIGGIEPGINFFLEQMRCLKPGGLAFHTTEFEYAGRAKKTLDSENLCYFRPEHIAQLGERLRAQGDRLWPVDFEGGSEPGDLSVDEPPYRVEPHINLRHGDWEFTSILLIAVRGEENRQNELRRESA